MASFLPSPLTEWEFLRLFYNCYNEAFVWIDLGLVDGVFHNSWRSDDVSAHNSRPTPRWRWTRKVMSRRWTVEELSNWWNPQKDSEWRVGGVVSPMLCVGLVVVFFCINHEDTGPHLWLSTKCRGQRSGTFSSVWLDVFVFRSIRTWWLWGGIGVNVGGRG